MFLKTDYYPVSLPKQMYNFKAVCHATKQFGVVFVCRLSGFTLETRFFLGKSQQISNKQDRGKPTCSHQMRIRRNSYFKPEFHI